MNIRTFLVTSTALLLGSGVAWTADNDSAESTIRLMGVAEAELPDAVTKEISLPAAVVEDSAAVDKAAKGLAKANENRERREKGLSQAEEARERRADMANDAQNNRESRGRSEDHPEPPKDPGPPSD